MNSEELFKKLPGLDEPWYIKQIRFDHEDKRVNIYVDFPKGSRFLCPEWGNKYGVHETEEGTWRHLNIFKYSVYIHAREPGIGCIEHGKRTVDLP